MGFGARLDARLLCGAALLALTAFGSAAHAADNAYNIPAQPLDRALRGFARFNDCREAVMGPDALHLPDGE